MNIEMIVLSLIFIFGIGAVWFLIDKKIGSLSDGKSEDKSILMLQQQVSQLSQLIDGKLAQTNEMTRQQMRENIQFIQDFSKNNQGHINSIIKEVTERLAKLDETNRQVVDFSAQLKNLQDILRNPKQRGVLGEYFLEETLKNVLPPKAFQMQYKFANGEIVDAVVFVDGKIIPIDSKFSLENYEQLLSCNDEDRRVVLEKLFKQDLKNRIDETSKYIRSDEKTFDFAFMFIPSESIYYDLLVNKVGAASISSRDLIDYAFKEKRVVIVSPTSFLAYLQTVLQGLRALEFEENNRLVRQKVETLGKHIVEYENYLVKMGTSLNTTINHYNNAHKKFRMIDKDVYRITDGKVGGEVECSVEIDKPVMEEKDVDQAIA